MTILLRHTTPEQFKAITKHLEQQCKTAWTIVDHARNIDDIGDETQLMASGLVNFLADLGVDGYEM